MERREFIKVLGFGVAGVSGVAAAAVTEGQATPGEAHIVRAGTDRFGTTRHMAMSVPEYKVASQDTSGGLFLFEHTNLTPGGPPLHLHWNQEEWFYVLEGEVAFQVGDRQVRLSPGDSLLAPRRVPHTFSSVSTTPSRMLIGFTPAGKMEAYFEAVQKPGAPAQKPEFWHSFEMDLVGPSPFWSLAGAKAIR